MGSHEILMAIYEIRGCSDPNDSPETLKERMDRIYELACRVMEETGFMPE